MKKRKFNSKAMKEFAEPKVVHESKPVDLITQFNRMRSIAADIYNSDFFMIASKAEQKKIDASIACISATMISMIGMEAIKNSHDCLPGDSGNGNDRSWDNLPDDSGNGTSTDKDSHDAIKKMMNIAYGETKSNSVEKAAARLALNSVHGAPSHIMAMNRRILSELGIKSPADKPDEDPFTFGNEHDDDSDGDEVKDYSEVNLGNFIDGPFYGQQYLDICRQYGFDAAETLKQFEKVASQYYIQMINLVDAVDSQDEITADKYTLEPGSVFFVTNKNDDKDPVFVLICAKSHIESFKIDKVSVKIKPIDLEESTKTNYIEFINSDAYFNIGKVHLSPNTVIDLDATLEKIKDEARKYGIDTITFVDTIRNVLDIYAEGKYTLETGSLFFVNNDGPNLIHFILVTKGGDIPGKIFARSIDPVGKPEESAKLNDIEFINSDAYFNIGKVHLSPNTVIDLDATLTKIKDEAREYGIDTITFVDTIRNSLDIYTKGKYTLEPGSLFCHRGNGWLNFMLIVKDIGTPDMVRFIWPVEKPKESTKLDDIKFVGTDAYYKIDKAYRNSDFIIDLDATLVKIKEKAKEKGIKTITFVDTIKEHGDIYTSGKYSLEPGSLFFIKEGYSLFVLFNETPTTFYYINPVVVFKKDDSEDESDSKEDGIEVVEAEDEIVDSDEASSDHCINDQYADVDTSKLNHDIYAGVSFPIFMKPTESGKYVSFVDICDIYNFDVSETIKRIKNVVYQENIGSIKYVDTIWSCDEIFRKDENDRYVYGNGSLFLMVNYTNAGKDPYFVILRKMWDDHVSEYVSTLYRINPVMKSAKINNVKEIKVIDDYADGNVRITKDLKNIISIEYDYKIKEICEKRNYDYEKMISCLRGVTAIIGGGTYLTFEGSVDSLNSIVSVDPVVAYKTCSVFFVSGFVDSEKGPYFVIYMPITGKTKNGYNFHLYRIYPILNLNQDSNTDSQDDSNVREINQFTTIYRANLEVSEADKDAYMKVEFSNIDRNDGEIQSLANICYTWKFKFYDTIKRIRFVAYMSNFEEIKYAGTACSHEEILEKEVLYSNGSALFVSDEEDPHFVIVEFINRSTRLIRINPVKE